MASLANATIKTAIKSRRQATASITEGSTIRVAARRRAVPSIGEAQELPFKMDVVTYAELVLFGKEDADGIFNGNMAHVYIKGYVGDTTLQCTLGARYPGSNNDPRFKSGDVEALLLSIGLARIEEPLKIIESKFGDEYVVLRYKRAES